MEVEQMMACLLAEIRINQEEMREEMKTNKARMDANQAEMLARMEAKMDTNLKEIIAWRKETTACQEAMEACLESKKPTSVKIWSVVIREEVPKKEATVEIF
jgi:thermostable 8-oxoguanine DNA glycosylase